MAKSLIAGCGYVGTALAQLLVAADHSVYAIRRAQSALPKGVTGIWTDLLDPELNKKIPRDIDFVFYTAAPDGRDEKSYRQVYCDGLKNLIDAVKVSSPSLRAFLLTSSTSVYGQENGEWVTEESPTEPQSFGGKSVLQGEHILRESEMPAIIVRFGGIYGPERTNLIEKIKQGLEIGHTHYTNRIHRDDCAGVLKHLAIETMPHEIYNAVDDAPVDQQQVNQWLAEQLGRTLVTNSSSNNTSLRPGNKRCDNRKLKNTGYTFLYPTFAHGYKQLLLDENRVL